MLHGYSLVTHHVHKLKNSPFVFGQRWFQPTSRKHTININNIAALLIVPKRSIHVLKDRYQSNVGKTYNRATISISKSSTHVGQAENISISGKQVTADNEKRHARWRRSNKARTQEHMAHSRRTHQHAPGYTSTKRQQHTGQSDTVTPYIPRSKNVTAAVLLYTKGTKGERQQCGILAV